MNSQIDRKLVTELVLKTLKDYLEENELEVYLSEDEDAKLFGGDGILDSLGLVSFIVSVEEAIEDEFNISIILADEKAMSRRTSPFGRISYLIDYIYDVIQTS
ncbi:hypothetical protein [Flavobacterium yafengii]|uniref:hypothetical protein n=1 Tax=Flavobacterium yafengii TaxID=3041253 RepID=UPI0024A9E928|nr:hypothetical protein [Flavobacterium yafengii]MDI6046666.1 hypothetical protein [Flavobacterium yafengii]